MCDAYFDNGKYRGPETDPDGWHVRAVLGVKKELKRVENRSRTICQSNVRFCIQAQNCGLYSYDVEK